MAINERAKEVIQECLVKRFHDLRTIVELLRGDGFSEVDLERELAITLGEWYPDLSTDGARLLAVMVMISKVMYEEDDYSPGLKHVFADAKLRYYESFNSEN